MKRIVQTVLVLAAIGCALVLSGTATVALAAAVNVPGWAHPAAVGIVEVVAVTGTWLWVTEPRLRWEAATAVVLASAVSGYAGVHAYGPFGLVGPVGAIVTTHLVARAWTVPATAGQNPVVDEGADILRTLHPNGVRTSSDPERMPDLEHVDERGLSRLWETAEEVEETVPGSLLAQLDQAEPGSGLDRSRSGAGDDRRVTPVVDRAAELIADGAGRRRLAKELDITEHQARELLAARRNGHPVITR